MNLRWNYVGWVLAALWLAAALSAVWPFAVVEGDDAGLAIAAIERNLAAPPAYAFGYRPDFQIGWVALTAWLARLSGGEMLVLQGAVSAGFALGNLGLLTEWTHRASGLPRWGAALLALAQQELVAQLYYANSTAPALTMLLLALLVVERDGRAGPSVVAGVCLGLSVWLRIDACVAGPALAAFAAVGAPRERCWPQLGWLAGGAVLSFGTLALLAGWQPGAVWQAWSQHQSIRFAWWQRGQAWLAFASAASGLVVLLGAWVAARTGARRLWVPAAVGAGVLGLALWGQLSTPKYLLWIAPWWCGLAGLGVRVAWRAGWAAVTALFALIALQYLAPSGSVRALLGPGAAWLGPALPPPADGLLHTDDAPRLLDGIVFAPSHWRVETRASWEAWSRLRERLGNGTVQILAASTWAGREASALALLEEGYVCREKRSRPGGRSTEAFRWHRERDGRTAWLLAFPEATRDAGQALRAALQLPDSRALWVFSRDVGGVARFHLWQFEQEGLQVGGPAHASPASLLEVGEVRVRPGASDGR